LIWLAPASVAASISAGASPTSLTADTLFDAT
jgi:hypothetical protein